MKIGIFTSFVIAFIFSTSTPIFADNNSDPDHLSAKKLCLNSQKWVEVEDKIKNQNDHNVFVYNCENTYSCTITVNEKSGTLTAPAPKTTVVDKANKTEYLLNYNLTMHANTFLTVILEKLKQDAVSEKKVFVCDQKSDLIENDPTICTISSKKATCAYHFGVSFGK